MKITKARTLNELKDSATELMSEYDTHVRTSLTLAKKLGRAFSKMREKFPEAKKTDDSITTGWKQWVNDNFDNRYQTTRIYIRIYESWDEIIENFGPDPAITIDEAMRYLRHGIGGKASQQLNQLVKQYGSTEETEGESDEPNDSEDAQLMARIDELAELFKQMLEDCPPELVFAVDCQKLMQRVGAFVMMAGKPEVIPGWKKSLYRYHEKRQRQYFAEKVGMDPSRVV